eukprot:364940-Chlamydomonas_euryale.AAC.8
MRAKDGNKGRTVVAHPGPDLRAEDGNKGRTAVAHPGPDLRAKDGNKARTVVAHPGPDLRAKDGNKGRTPIQLNQHGPRDDCDHLQPALSDIATATAVARPKLHFQRRQRAQRGRRQHSRRIQHNVQPPALPPRGGAGGGVAARDGLPAVLIAAAGGNPVRVRMHVRIVHVVHLHGVWQAHRRRRHAAAWTDTARRAACATASAPKAAAGAGAGAVARAVARGASKVNVHRGGRKQRRRQRGLRPQLLDGFRHVCHVDVVVAAAAFAAMG